MEMYEKCGKKWTNKNTKKVFKISVVKKGRKMLISSDAHLKQKFKEFIPFHFMLQSTFKIADMINKRKYSIFIIHAKNFSLIL